MTQPKILTCIFGAMTEIQYLTSPLIGVKHGFFTRHGGVSPEPFFSLNFGGSEDSPANIDENRKRALETLGLSADSVSHLYQVHGTDIPDARSGCQTGDGLVTNRIGLPLAVGAADCYPLLFHDPVAGVIGAAHCGWKGTLGKIAANTVRRMCELGAATQNIRAAIGPGISRMNYEVSEEVITMFMNAGFPSSIHTGRFLDLLEANRFVLEESGVLTDHIWALNRCTTEPDFFSYRRDKGKTGRMWAVISL